jgi:hypothetical protein
VSRSRPGNPTTGAGRDSSVLRIEAAAADLRGDPSPTPAAGRTPIVAGQPVLTPYETGAPNVVGGTAAPPQLPSPITVSGADINARPLTHPGEVVEAAPGLVAIEHSDGGKANQYYLRGWCSGKGKFIVVLRFGHEIARLNRGLTVSIVEGRSGGGVTMNLPAVEEFGVSRRFESDLPP